MKDANYGYAFISGLIAFFSPCILPLLPVYFGYLVGEAIDRLDDSRIKAKLVLNAFGFVIGVTFLNVMLGFGIQALATPLKTYGDTLRIIGGILLIVFGIYFILDLKWLFFERERRIQFKSFTPGFIKSFIFGITFSFGWTPCNGPIISSILIIAAFEKNYLRAGTLMLTYSAGFSILFLGAALLVGVFIKKYKKVFPYFGIIKRVSGVLMVIMGLLLFFDKVNMLNQF